jgi:hypothetical protein
VLRWRSEEHGQEQKIYQKKEAANKAKPGPALMLDTVAVQRMQRATTVEDGKQESNNAETLMDAMDRVMRQRAVEKEKNPFAVKKMSDACQKTFTKYKKMVAPEFVRRGTLQTERRAEARSDICSYMSLIGVLASILMGDEAGELEVDFSALEALLDDPLSNITLEDVEECLKRFDKELEGLEGGLIDREQFKNFDLTGIFCQQAPKYADKLLLARGSKAMLRKLRKSPAGKTPSSRSKYKPRMVGLMPMTNAGGTLDMLVVKFRDRKILRPRTEEVRNQ